MSALPLLELGADPDERGVAHGRALGAKVREVVEVYLRRFEAGGAEPARIAAEAELWAEAIARANPEYHAEMAGLARGAEVPLRDVALLNARYEIAYCLFSAEAKSASGSEPDGCTAFGLMPEMTASGRTIIGQNWDWLAGLRGRTFVMRVRRPDKPDFVGFTEAGIVGCKMAVNEHGIGLCVNGLVTRDDGKYRYRKPLHVRCRELIDAPRFDLALLPMLQEDRVASANILVGQAEGEIIDLELTPDHANPLYPDDGLVVHANHLVHPRSPQSQIERISPSTLYRDVRVRRAMARRRGRLDVAAIRDILSDHFAHPAAVCRHEDPALPAARRTITVACIVLDLDARVLHASAGPPCESALSAYPLAPEAGAG